MITTTTMMMMPSTSTGSSFSGLATQQASNLPIIIIISYRQYWVHLMNVFRCGQIRSWQLNGRVFGHLVKHRSEAVDRVSGWWTVSDDLVGNCEAPLTHPVHFSSSAAVTVFWYILSRWEFVYFRGGMYEMSVSVFLLDLYRTWLYFWWGTAACAVG